jgi:hypothetical protein
MVNRLESLSEFEAPRERARRQEVFTVTRAMRRMDRRRFLAGTGATVASVALAGCSALGSPTSLPAPEETVEDDGETHLRFSESGERIATLSVMPRGARTDGSVVPATTSLAHRDGTKVTSLTLELRSPPSGGGVPADVAVTIPQWKPAPSVELSSAVSDGAVVDIQDMGGQGEGTVTLDFFVQPTGELPVELLVDVTFTLREGKGVLGGRFEGDGRTEVTLSGDS